MKFPSRREYSSDTGCKDSLRESRVNRAVSIDMRWISGSRCWHSRSSTHHCGGKLCCFERHRESIRTEKQHELAGIAELKTRKSPTGWKSARAMRKPSGTTLVSGEVDRWLQQGGPAGETKIRLTERLNSLQQAYAAYGYTRFPCSTTRPYCACPLPQKMPLPASTKSNICLKACAADRYFCQTSTGETWHGRSA